MITDDRHGEKRRRLLSFYRTALARVHGERVVADYLAAHPIEGEWAVVAIGKAASAMATGAQRHLGSAVHSGLVITRYGYAEWRPDGDKWQTLESNHPLPDEASLRAGEQLLLFLDGLPDSTPLLFLLSGGASALVEVLPSMVTLDDLIRVNDWLLASGLSIGQMNSVRQSLSLLKAGRLAHHLCGRRCLQLLISDVPGDDPAVIGSAPLWPANILPPDNLPGWLNKMLQQLEMPPAMDAPDFANIETHIIADNTLALQAVKTAAEAEGLPVYLQPGHFQGDAAELGRRFVRALLQGDDGLYLWGGESSVQLPHLHGHGGRSQHLALAAADLLTGHDDILFLAAATDGSDGPGEVAGALVDGSTLQRGEDEGFSYRLALAHADSGSFLAASGDLIETGVTGSNVMDLVIGWKVGED